MPNVDFNGDGRADVLWLYGGDAAVSNWLGTSSGGFLINDANALTQLNAMHTFQFKITGDFNGDGRTDIIWMLDPHNGTGDYLTGLTGLGGALSVFDAKAGFIVADPAWQIVGSGDFNGDGVDDLLWRHSNGTLSNWLGSASGNFTINDANALIHVPNDWHVLGTGDFNGDGRDDILWQSDGGMVSNWLATASGGWIINDANALTDRAPGAIIGIGDFNGDGLDDLLFRNGLNQLYTSATGQDGYFDLHMMIGYVTSIPSEWQVVAVDDYNGDGIDDLLWRSTSGGFSNWLGVGDQYGFIINDDDAGADIPVSWQVAEQPLL